MIIIGTDCPDLSQNIIEDAFLALNSHDVVLGPASDGGYYLIGMQQFTPEIFQNITWSTEQVLQQTIDVITNKNKSYYF